ncbi:MAG: ACT domain-containing protein [Candidatus Omnitrophica bacterium]|nr:ACT domain-containing protein [Candidatus Omnitrophota bacterium]
MKITQISVFLENKKGRLYDAIRVLGEKGIDIKTLTIAENEDFGVLRMIVDKPQEAMEILKVHEFIASITDIVAIEVDDHPGGLAKVLKVLDENKVNIEYMYAFVEKRANKAILVFRFDDLDKAIAVLAKNSIRVIGGKDIGNL